MNDILEIALIFAGWVILAKYILPALEIPTCMSGQCRIPTTEQKTESETSVKRDENVQKSDNTTL